VNQQPAIEVRDLRVVRGGNVIVDGVSLSIAAGSVTGLLGPSGSGKTTLMRSIVGLQRIAGGSVDVLGLPGGSPALRSRVGYVTQTPAVYGDLTVVQNLRYFASILGASRERVSEVLRIVGLERYAARAVASLSGGERARVSLGTALLNNPPVLILDEPTVGLDPVLRGELWRTFAELAAGGAALLVSSHVMDEAARCDSLILMRAGRVLAQDTPAALLARTGAADMEHAFLSLIHQSSPSTAEATA
jgi:ABC-2 type transport system ATP-binding protein